MAAVVPVTLLGSAAGVFGFGFGLLSCYWGVWFYSWGPCLLVGPDPNLANPSSSRGRIDPTLTPPELTRTDQLVPINTPSCRLGYFAASELCNVVLDFKVCILFNCMYFLVFGNCIYCDFYW